MQPASDLDGIDFKPFFDMVVGILFVLLILIGSLLFFQTADKDTAKDEQAAMREWRMEIAAFLDLVAGHLQAHGIDAKVDLAKTTIVIPLGEFARLDSDGLPSISTQPTQILGRILADDLACVTFASQHIGPCAAFHLLRTNQVVAELRVGAFGASSQLSQERLGSLLSSQFAAAVFRNSPDLLKLSASDGRALIKTNSAISTTSPLKGDMIVGDLGVTLDFVPP